MNNLYVVISFVLANVFVAALDQYIKEVIKTNQQLELVNAELPKLMRTIVVGEFSIEQMTLMLAVPERPINTLTELWGIRPYKTGILFFEFLMQSVIKDGTNIDPPEITNEEDYETITLECLGTSRRRITIEAVKKLISSVIGKDPDFDNSFLGYRNMCRLIGLFMMIEKPTPYIVSAKVEEETCFIKDVDINESRYKYISGEIWCIWTPFQLLSS